MTSSDENKINAELAEADDLIEKALKLKDSGNFAKFESAIEYADQAHSIYKRHNSPKAEEAQNVRDELYDKLKKRK